MNSPSSRLLKFSSLYIQFNSAVLRVSVAVLVSPVPTSTRSRTFLHPSRLRISFNPGPGEILLPSKDCRFIIFNFNRCQGWIFFRITPHAQGHDCGEIILLSMILELFECSGWGAKRTV